MFQEIEISGQTYLISPGDDHPGNPLLPQVSVQERQRAHQDEAHRHRGQRWFGQAEEVPELPVATSLVRSFFAAYALVQRRPEFLPKGRGWFRHVDGLHDAECLPQTAHGRRTGRARRHVPSHLLMLFLLELALNEGEQVWLDVLAAHLIHPLQSPRAGPAVFGLHETHWLVPPLRNTATLHQSLCTKDSDAGAGRGLR